MAKTILPTTATVGQALIWNGTEWVPQAVSGSGLGDVSGPASATDGNIAVFDGTTGKLIKDGGKKVADLATKSATVTATLEAANWVGSSVPYTYDLTVSGVTATSNQDILPTTDITSTQLAALQAANIVDAGQSTDTISLKAYGTKPAVDIPVRVVKRGD